MNNTLPSIRNLWWQLFLRDLKARYKQTLLGAVWGLGRPLLELAVFTVVFGTILNAPSDNAPYPLFVYTGIVMWTFVAGALPRATESLVNHAGLVANLPFPKGTIPLASVGAALFDSLIAASLLIVAMVYYAAPVTSAIVWLVPLAIVLTALVSATSVILSALNVFYRDVRHLVELGVRVLFFLTPVVYASSAVPARYETWYRLNPLVGIFEGVRTVLIEGAVPQLGSIVYPTVATVLLSIVASMLFVRTEPYFAESV